MSSSRRPQVGDRRKLDTCPTDPRRRRSVSADEISSSKWTRVLGLLSIAATVMMREQEF
jgi:hypothetical protein